MRLPCHGECNIPVGYMEAERARIETLRTDFIERIDHRNILMGFKVPVAECERMFEEQILEAGMTYDEAVQVLHQMHRKNMNRQSGSLMCLQEKV